MQTTAQVLPAVSLAAFNGLERSKQSEKHA